MSAPRKLDLHWSYPNFSPSHLTHWNAPRKVPPMSLPPLLRTLRLPAIASPMFIVSTPDLVIAQCKAGIVGSFPALNARPAEMLDEWLRRITGELAEYMAVSQERQAGDHSFTESERTLLSSGNSRLWLIGLHAYTRRWVEEHKDRCLRVEEIRAEQALAVSISVRA